MAARLDEALADAGGTAAPPSAGAQLRTLLDAELARGAGELERVRSGYGDPVVAAVAEAGPALVAAAPLAATVRGDTARAPERAWLLAAALVGALVDAGDGRAAAELALAAGSLPPGGWLVLSLPAAGGDAETAALAFEDHVAPVDRLRAVAHAVPAHVLERVEDVRPPLEPAHPLRVAEAVARAGGRPADARSVDALEEAVLARLAGPRGPVRPHADPDPARRVARRILQRLAGMGKWGGYHTAFDHLARGFEGNDRRLAQDVGERLLAAGLLAEKPSVGQRHVFLDPARAADIHALIDDGVVPPTLDLG